MISTRVLKVVSQVHGVEKWALRDAFRADG